MKYSVGVSVDLALLQLTCGYVVGFVGCFETVEHEHAGAVCLFMRGDAQLLLVATTRVGQVVSEVVVD